MRVTLFKAFPDSYRESMSLYGRYLQEKMTPLLNNDESVQSYLPGFIRVRPAFYRYICQYLGYPAAAFFHQGEVNHILDHSYAHLLHSLNPKKTVVTFHDAIWLKSREDGFRAHQNKKLRWVETLNLKGLQKAARIICVSEASKKTLLHYLKFPEERVAVIASGLHPVYESSAAVKSWPGLTPGPYLLHVGHTQAYKNIPALFHVLAYLKKSGSPIKLLKVGTPFTADQESLAVNLGITQQIVHLGKVPQEQLPSVYRAAQILLLPSLDEGFGFPVLEAMAMGVPVVTSNRGSLPELVGNAGILTEPDDYSAMAKSISRILENQHLRQQMIAEGRMRAQPYTWEKTAQKTLTVYREITAGERK